MAKEITIGKPKVNLKELNEKIEIKAELKKKKKA